MNPELQLRDIHLPPEPSWWPPAPGWWLLAALVVVTAWWIARGLARRARVKRRIAALYAEFDAAAAIAAPHERLAAVSELLRRAARSADPSAAALRGDAWLRFLDGTGDPLFSAGPGRALLDGPYRGSVAPEVAAAAIAPARRRFVELVAPR